MEPITIRLSPDTLEDVDAEADERGASRAEYLREIIVSRHDAEEIRSDYEAKLSEYEENLKELEERLESREERIETLEEQLRRRSQVEEKVDVLARRVEEPDPPFWVRWRRWFGRDRVESEGTES